MPVTNNSVKTRGNIKTRTNDEDIINLVRENRGVNRALNAFVGENSTRIDEIGTAVVDLIKNLEDNGLTDGVGLEDIEGIILPEDFNPDKNYILTLEEPPTTQTTASVQNNSVTTKSNGIKTKGNHSSSRFKELTLDTCNDVSYVLNSTPNDNLTTLGNAVDTTNQMNNIKLSNDGKTAVLANYSVNGLIHVYKYDDNTWSKVFELSGIAGIEYKNFDIDYSGNKIVVFYVLDDNVGNKNSILETYIYNNNTYEMLPNGSITNNNTTFGDVIYLSPDGNSLAVSIVGESVYTYNYNWSTKSWDSRNDINDDFPTADRKSDYGSFFNYHHDSLNGTHDYILINNKNLYVKLDHRVTLNKSFNISVPDHDVIKVSLTGFILSLKDNNLTVTSFEYENQNPNPTTLLTIPNIEDFDLSENGEVFAVLDTNKTLTIYKKLNEVFSPVLSTSFKFGTNEVKLNSISVSPDGTKVGVRYIIESTTNKFVVIDITNYTESITLVQDCDMLKYNSTSKQWENTPHILNNICDVTIGGTNNPLVDGNVLKYDGSKWVNSTVSGGGGGASVLNDLTNVTIGGTNNPLVDGNVLKYDSDNNIWVNGASKLNDLTDVTLGTNLVEGNVLRYDGSNWVESDLTKFDPELGTNTGVCKNIKIGNKAGQFAQDLFAVAIGCEAGNNDQGLEAVAVGKEAGKDSQGIQAVAVGYFAGQTSQGNSAVAVGNNAGQTSQGESAVAVGTAAGYDSQGGGAVAVGNSAGYDSQGTYAVAIGNTAGNISQRDNAVAVGNASGQTSQQQNAVAVGFTAGLTSQGLSAVAVGNGAGQTSQGNSAVAIGLQAGYTSQGDSAVAVGNNAGNTSQGGGAVAVGKEAGQTSQGFSAVAVGHGAGNDSQKDYAVAVGNSAGNSNQGASAVAVGDSAGNTSQGFYAVAVGIQAGNTSQGNSAVAVGTAAGYDSQKDSAVAVGNLAGNTSQGLSAVAVGKDAGNTSQGFYAVAVGIQAGQTSQGNSAVAVGNSAGNSNQGASAVAVGLGAGHNNQGPSAVAVGNLAGNISQRDNAVAVGNYAGAFSQQPNAVAVGNSAGQTSQQQNAVAVGNEAGNTSQGNSAVAVGFTAGNILQGNSAVAVGRLAGQTSQGDSAVALGRTTGVFNQGESAVAVGRSAGYTSQGNHAIGVGRDAGQEYQGNFAVAVGKEAGFSNQKECTVAIGNNAGHTLQGTQAIAIGRGAGYSSQLDKTICLGNVNITSASSTGSNGKHPVLGIDCRGNEFHETPTPVSGVARGLMVQIRSDGGTYFGYIPVYSNWINVSNDVVNAPVDGTDLNYFADVNIDPITNFIVGSGTADQFTITGENINNTTVLGVEYYSNGLRVQLYELPTGSTEIIANYPQTVVEGDYFKIITNCAPIIVNIQTQEPLSISDVPSFVVGNNYDPNDPIDPRTSIQVSGTGLNTVTSIQYLKDDFTILQTFSNFNVSQDGTSLTINEWYDPTPYYDYKLRFLDSNDQTDFPVTNPSSGPDPNNIVLPASFTPGHTFNSGDPTNNKLQLDSQHDISAQFDTVKNVIYTNNGNNILLNSQVVNNDRNLIITFNQTFTVSESDTIELSWTNTSNIPVTVTLNPNPQPIIYPNSSFETGHSLGTITFTGTNLDRITELKLVNSFNVEYQNAITGFVVNSTGNVINVSFNTSYIGMSGDKLNYYTFAGYVDYVPITIAISSEPVVTSIGGFTTGDYVDLIYLYGNDLDLVTNVSLLYYGPENISTFNKYDNTTIEIILNGFTSIYPQHRIELTWSGGTVTVNADVLFNISEPLADFVVDQSPPNGTTMTVNGTYLDRITKVEYNGTQLTILTKNHNDITFDFGLPQPIFQQNDSLTFTNETNINVQVQTIVATEQVQNDPNLIIDPNFVVFNVGQEVGILTNFIVKATDPGFDYNLLSFGGLFIGSTLALGTDYTLFSTTVGNTNQSITFTIRFFNTNYTYYIGDYISVLYNGSPINVSLTGDFFVSSGFNVGDQFIQGNQYDLIITNNNPNFTRYDLIQSLQAIKIDGFDLIVGIHITTPTVITSGVDATIRFTYNDTQSRRVQSSDYITLSITQQQGSPNPPPPITIYAQ